MSENLLFGRYEILEKLGDGGSSEVSRAFDTRMEREVAIKKVASHPRARERALREAKTVASLNHPNIVTLFDFVESSDNYFLIMEYLKGHALSAILRLKTRLSEPEVVAVGQQVCRALEYAHANGVIHRDIKPHNLNIGPDGRLKVMDFGIARLRSSELTREGEILGTFAYMSPEQTEGGHVEKTTDIFSLGATLFQALTGDPPFTAETPAAVVQKIVHEACPPPSKTDKAVSKTWDRLLLKALEKDPADRFQSAKELEHRIETLGPDDLSAQKILKALASEAKAISPAEPTGFKDRLLGWSKDRTGLVKKVAGTLFVCFNFWLLGPELFFYPTEAFYLFLTVLFLAGLYRLSIAAAIMIGLFTMPLLISSFSVGALLTTVLAGYWLIFTRKSPFNSLVPWTAPYLSMLNLGLAFPLTVGLAFPPLAAGLIGLLGGATVELFGIFLERPFLEVSFAAVAETGSESSVWQAFAVFLDRPFLFFQIGLWGLGASIVSLLARKQGVAAHLAAVFLGSLFLAVGYTSVPIPLGLRSPSPELVLQALSFSLIILLTLVAILPQGRGQRYQSALERPDHPR